MPKADEVRLRHMLDAGREALGYVQGRSRADLESDTMLARAVVRCLEIIGEAAARTSEATRSRYNQVPWAEMVGMRNSLIHAYFDIDLDTVWATLMDDLPPLIAKVEAILAAAHASGS
ncbi:MAG: DUF86 domain-containing protein [Anaerolineales bacterium]|nr:DUF86 domain-containing protein [Anaerolineales bacterium]